MLYRNLQFPDSKCNWVMDSLEEGWPGLEHHFWGFINNNQSQMKQLTEQGIDWYFWDMPFWGRWSRYSDREHYWHAAKNKIYPNILKKYPGDRFKKWNCSIKDTSPGKHILVCPSSDTMTRWITGKGMHDWVHDIVLEIKEYTDRPIHIRYKPRVKGISGPDAEVLTGSNSIQQELEDCWCVVTTVSLVAVEAQLAGVPTFCSEQSFAAPVSETDISKIESPVYKDRQPWLNWLAYNQFTEHEIRSGLAYEILND